MNPSYLPAPATRVSTDEPVLAEERRDNRIVALVMAASVAVSLVLLYVH